MCALWSLVIIPYTLEEDFRQLQRQPAYSTGDGRCDSPGKSTKFCTYSFIE